MHPHAAQTKIATLPLPLLVSWAAWAAFLGVITVTYSSDKWDECAYLLSAMALRGYPTPYAAHRAPLTGIISAAFIDCPALLNPVLIGGILAILSLWGAKRWGLLGACLPLTLLLGQNVFIVSCVDLMSELPAAVSLLVGFYFLARERFVCSGAALAIACLARWNIALMPASLTIVIAARFGWKATARYVFGGALIAALFLVLSLALVDHPFESIVRGNLVPAYAWAPEGEEKPDILARLQFYVANSFFLPPHQNSWANSGSGRSDSVWYSAICAVSGDLKP